MTLSTTSSKIGRPLEQDGDVDHGGDPDIDDGDSGHDVCADGSDDDDNDKDNDSDAGDDNGDVTIRNYDHDEVGSDDEGDFWHEWMATTASNLLSDGIF